MVEHVADLESDEPALDLSDGLHEDSADESECESVESMAEASWLINAKHHGSPGYSNPREGHVGTSHRRDNDVQGDDHSPHH